MSYPKDLQRLFDSLNEHQVAAVNFGAGQACLVGVPGAGKTRTIVARVARMAADGLDPDYVLAMTFTRAAAMEMTSRLEELGITKARVGTIHSVCRQIVAAESSLLQHGRLDEKGKLPIELKRVLGDFRRRGLVQNYGVDLQGVVRFVEACKAKGPCYVDGDPFGLNLQSEEFLYSQARKWSRLAGVREKTLVDLYIELERRRSTLGLYDFDDMLLWSWLQLVTSPESLSRWRSRWALAIVDECFHALTPVTMANGKQIAIKDVVERKLSGPALSYDAHRGCNVERPITGWHKILLTKAMMRVVIRCRSSRDGQHAPPVRYLVCTEDQGVWTSAGWTTASSLRPGDVVTVESSTPRHTHSNDPFANKVKHSRVGRKRLGELISGRNAVGTCGCARGHGRIVHRGGNGTGMSSVEQVVCAKLGSDWRWNYPVAPSDGTRPFHYKLDFARPDLRIAIEVDGRSHSVEARRVADDRKDHRLAASGWRVVRITNAEALRISRCELLTKAGLPACPVEADVVLVEPWFPKDVFVYDIDIEGTHTFYADGIVVHNCQDSNPVQWDIARLLVGLDSCVSGVERLPTAPKSIEGIHSLMVAGDPSQCHPTGTMIDVDGHEKLAIEDLQQGAVAIRGWNRHGQGMRRGRSFRVAGRRYSGPMLHVSTSTRTTRVTPNHRFLCRWTDREALTCVTYLMYRHGFGYRVGWCQLFTHRGPGDHGFHLSTRARIEKADLLWILRAHSSRTDASCEESIVAARYGLPTSTFEPVHGTTHITSLTIARIFAALASENEERGRRCLLDYGRDPELPFWPWPSKPTGAYSRATYFEVFATNLISGIMSVPVPDARNSWAVLNRVERSQYTGWVYSLDVEQDHSYAADDIVVLNSIYKWRSADPNLFVQFSKNPEVSNFVLPLNYRSNQTVCSVATMLVGGKPWHLGGEIISTHSEDNLLAVTVRRFNHAAEEGETVVEQCREIALTEGLRSCALLSRLRVGLDLAEIACIRRRMPYIKMASGSFFESREVRDVLAYMRVASSFDPDGSWLRHIINRPFRYIGVPFINKAAAWSSEKGLSLLDGLSTLSEELNYKQQKAISSLYAVLQKLNLISVRAEERLKAAAELGPDVKVLTTTAPLTDEGLIKTGTEEIQGPADMIAIVLRETDYIEELRREEGLIGMDESRIAALAALKRMAAFFPTARQFLSYVDALTIAVQQAKKTGLKLKEGAREDALVLSTIHRCKGLEWKHVFLVDVVQGRFPCSKAEDPDEELRLLYVAVTRAMDTCQLSYVGEEEDPANNDCAPMKSSFVLRVEQALRYITEHHVKKEISGK